MGKKISRCHYYSIPPLSRPGLSAVCQSYRSRCVTGRQYFSCCFSQTSRVHRSSDPRRKWFSLMSHSSELSGSRQLRQLWSWMVRATGNNYIPEFVSPVLIRGEIQHHSFVFLYIFLNLFLRGWAGEECGWASVAQALYWCRAWHRATFPWIILVELIILPGVTFHLNCLPNAAVCEVCSKKSTWSTGCEVRKDTGNTLICFLWRILTPSSACFHLEICPSLPPDCFKCSLVISVCVCVCGAFQVRYLLSKHADPFTQTLNIRVTAAFNLGRLGADKLSSVYLWLSDPNTWSSAPYTPLNPGTQNTLLSLWEG